MAPRSRLRLEMEGRIAFLILVASILANIFAQQRRVVWFQAINTCIFLACCVIALRASILLKQSREPLTPAIRKIASISQIIFVAIFVCGFGVLAMLGNTRRGWMIWAAISLFLIGTLLWNRRKGSNQSLQPTAGRSNV